MLAGVRVLEFGQYIAGPLTGMLLADLGADVIKVEAPGGDPFRFSPSYETYNRNKRILRLDLRSEAGRREAQRLAAGADVVIEGSRGGLLEAAGVKARAEVITCALPGFAPEMGLSEGAGWDQVMGAGLGLYRPADGKAPGSPPAYSALPFASTFAGLLAANSIVAALLARLRSGLGQSIEVPVHSAMFYGIGFNLLRTNWEGGETPARPDVPNPMVGLYECSDGRWIQLHASLDHFIEAFIAELSLEEWRDEGMFEGLRLRQDAARATELQRRLRGLFATAASADWEARLSAAGMSCTTCLRVEEWLDHPHARESGLVVELPTRFGLMKQPGRLVQAASLAAMPLRAARRASDDPNWGPSARAAPGAGETITSALEGVKVLDLCMVLAGPTAGRVLAEFGADVIKVDRLEPTTSEAFWLDANRGKRSLLVDLKSTQGQEIFWKLAADADVIVENMRAGVADRLGVGYSEASKRVPGVVYASLNCYGYEGPFAERPGWEHLAQAVTGMQVRYGGREGQPRLAPYAVNDYGTGLAASLGVLAALYQRQLTGKGERVTTALAATAGLLQAPYMFDFPGYERREVEGPEARGLSSWSRLYEAADGWAYLHCPDNAIPHLLKRPEFRAIAALLSRGETCEVESAVSKEMAVVLKTGTVQQWVDALACDGVWLMKVTNSWDLFEDPKLREAGLIVTTDNEEYGSVEHVGIPHRLSRTPARNGRPTPTPGADTAAVLKGIGYKRREINAMKMAGIVRMSAFD